MSVAAVAAVAGKAGGTGLLMVGVPGTLYASKDYVLFYSVEREILKSDSKFTSTKESTAPTVGTGETYVTSLYFGADKKWSCVVSAKKTTDSSSGETLDAEKLKKHFDARLPITPANTGDPSTTTDVQTKQLNKDLLFWDCYKTRKVESDGKLTSSFVFFAKKASGDTNWTVDLFGKKETQQES